jgi:hypothetical protein
MDLGEQLRTYEQRTRNEQVSGSSPLVGSTFCVDLQDKREENEDCGSKPVAF